MSSLTYEDRVTFSLGRWLGGDKTRRQIVVLASLLNCPFMGNTRVPAIRPPDGPATEALIHRTWLAVLRSYYPSDMNAAIVEGYLVVGLLQNNRWRALLETEQGAREWVGLVTRFLDHGTSSMPNTNIVEDESYGPVVAAIVPILDTWIGSDYREDNCYDARAMASILFGEPWCDLVFDSRSRHASLADVVSATAPSFIDGVLSIAELPAQELPALGP